MQIDQTHIAQYNIIQSSQGVRFRFYCALSHILVYETPIIPESNSENGLFIAWGNYARSHFNLCQHCGRWVADIMFNVEENECVACSPWVLPPRFCDKCGEILHKDCCRYDHTKC